MDLRGLNTDLLANLRRDGVNTSRNHVLVCDTSLDVW
jgi:hypothetical protein